jgi:rod shape-determining protein MreC
MIVARITGEDIKNWFKSLIIDKGRQDGLKERMPVITPKGIVGQIVEINRWHSRVMVLNDRNSCVDTYVEGKETRGILEGKGETTLLLKYVLKTDDITIGDKLITSGKDGIYPKNLYAGIVINVDRQRPGIISDIEVKPFNNFKRLDEVIILKPE